MIVEKICSETISWKLLHEASRNSLQKVHSKSIHRICVFVSQPHLLQRHLLHINSNLSELPLDFPNAQLLAVAVAPVAKKSCGCTPKWPDWNKSWSAANSWGGHRKKNPEMDSSEPHKNRKMNLLGIEGWQGLSRTRLWKQRVGNPSKQWRRCWLFTKKSKGMVSKLPIWHLWALVNVTFWSLRGWLTSLHTKAVAVIYLRFRLFGVSPPNRSQPYHVRKTLPKKTTTVDGWNPAPVDRRFIPLFIGFHTSQVVVWDFSHQQ